MGGDDAVVLTTGLLASAARTANAHIDTSGRNSFLLTPAHCRAPGAAGLTVSGSARRPQPAGASTAALPAAGKPQGLPRTVGPLCAARGGCWWAHCAPWRPPPQALIGCNNTQVSVPHRTFDPALLSFTLTAGVKGSLRWARGGRGSFEATVVVAGQWWRSRAAAGPLTS